MRVHVDLAELVRARKAGKTTLLPAGSYKGILLPLIAETIEEEAMFTGLIEGLGRVERAVRRGPDLELTIETGFEPGGMAVGDSIAVSGPCLTATRVQGSSFSADVSAESLSKSNLGRLGRGDQVNLERALKWGDRLGGHLVSGHIDGLAEVVSIDRVGGSIRFRFGLDPGLMRYVIPKGSVAVDGISLTVNRVGPSFFEVNIIPLTTQETTLGLNKPGDVVNIETDLIGKYVEKLTGPHQDREQGIDLDLLARHGFTD